MNTDAFCPAVATWSDVHTVCGWAHSLTGALTLSNCIHFEEKTPSRKQLIKSNINNHKLYAQINDFEYGNNSNWMNLLCFVPWNWRNGVVLLFWHCLRSRCTLSALGKCAIENGFPSVLMPIGTFKVLICFKMKASNPIE